MFITRRRLEEIKQSTRWEREREIDREREISEMHQKIWELERRLDKLEGKTNPNIPVLNERVL